MSSLQIGLAISGGVVLAAVVAHSAWTSRKNKPRQAQPVDQGEASDPSLATANFYSPQEPAFDTHTAATPTALDTPPVISVEPTISQDPVNDMALAMMHEATMHAQRAPNAADMARIAADKAQAAERAAEEKRQLETQASRDIPSPDLIPVEKRPSLDALIDVIAGIEIEHPISGEATLASMPPTRRVGNKLFILEGLHAETGQWEHPRNGHRYSHF